MLGLAHLDRPFDYLVDADQDAQAVPGARLRVRFSGRLVDAFLLARLERSEHDGKLGWIDRVVSPEPVLTPEVAQLCRSVADRYAGTMSDVVRLAVPPRHARTEKEEAAAPPPPFIDPDPELTRWAAYRGAQAFAAAVAAGRAPRAAWQSTPGEDWPARLAELIGHTVAAGRGVIAVVPDQRDLDRLEWACAPLGERCVTLAAGLGPTARYRRWLAALRGGADVVLGTRSAVFAPVRNLGLIVVWDDGDPSLDEPRAPYPHPREVAVLRSHQQQCGLLLAGVSRTAEVQSLVAAGWAHDVVAERAVVRERGPRVLALDEENRVVGNDPLVRLARVPEFAFRLARTSLDADRPVLISVPRRGYLPSLSCAKCRTHARCRACHGPLAMAPDGSVSCRWCGRVETSVRCAVCGSTEIRARTVGAARTAEELGRAFRGVPVLTSDGAKRTDRIPGGARLVVATPGAEPVVEPGQDDDGGYGTVIAVDTWAHLDREDLRAEEDAARHWFSLGALARPARDGGTLVILADNDIPVVQAVVRWDPVAFAAEQLAQRVELGFPPAVTMAAVDGTAEAVRLFVDLVELPADAGILGPVPLPPGVRPPPGDFGPKAEFERLLFRVDRSRGRELARALSLAQARRATGRDGGPLRVQVDPPTIG
ncbi:primosomal protein N' [Gordonia sp. X0973]|uniref:primosomal protein N' n=1 Tax=Gordonia sp. X0973 TaxID=2742602 RepID=UPI000F52BD38|nr:primosomal protein N' [Gordonia sp. X0973]QKT09133.1 primosomal protein N' [Gordonia sp. X0973]